MCMCADYVCGIHDNGYPFTNQHVDCYDGQHLRACHKHTERMVPTGKPGEANLIYVTH